MTSAAALVSATLKDVEQPQQWPSRKANSLMEFIRVLKVRLCKHENKQRTEAGELLILAEQREKAKQTQQTHMKITPVMGWHPENWV